MSTLERAIVIAAEGHAGKLDKAGAPYILHPLRVMLRMSREEERIVAVLHDVVEDCRAWSFDKLRAEGFTEEVIEALEAVTKRREEEDPEGRTEGYMRFIMRAAANPIGRAVKLADLEDNMDLSRIARPREGDFWRIEKYRQAMSLIKRPFQPGPAAGDADVQSG